MSRKKCVRKVWGLVNPIQHAIDGASITPDHLLDRLRLVELSAIESFTKGQATVEDWKSLADLLNVAETMSRGGVGPEVLEACERAQDGLSDAHDRFKITGRMGLSGPAIQAMRDLAEYHDLQRSSISRGEYERWIVKTRNQIRGAVANRRMAVATP